MESDLKKRFFSRNRLLLGDENLFKLSGAKVAVLGIGGVGSVVCEQLTRLGLSKLLFYARGQYDFGNINRQIPATYINVKSKTKKIHALSQRLVSINPFINISAMDCDIDKEMANIESHIRTEEVDVIFNCVDEYNAQHKVAVLAQNIGCNMIIGGVTGIGNRGIISTFRPNTKYSEYFTYAPSKDNSIDSEIKSAWINSVRSELSEEVLDTYNNDMASPYPVITPLPWMVASQMILEFIKILTNLNDIVFAPKAIELKPFDCSMHIVDLKKGKPELKFFPWRP